MEAIRDAGALMDMLHRQWWEAVEDSHVPVLIVKPHGGHLLGANRSFLRLLGRGLETGSPLSEVFTRDSLGQIQRAIRVAFKAGSSGPLRVSLLNQEGHSIECKVEARPVIFKAKKAVELKVQSHSGWQLGITHRAADFFKDLTQIAPFLHDFEQVLDRIVERFAEALEFHAFVLSTVERGELARVTIYTGERSRAELLGQIQEKVMEALLRLGVRIEPAKLSYSIRERGWIPRAEKPTIGSQLILPIPIDGKSGIHGVGGLFHEVQDAFEVEDKGLFAAFVGGIASSYLVYHSFRKVEEQSQRDPLTGLMNRRGVIKRMEDRGQFGLFRAWPICMIMIDIDRFKDINDRWGHRVGDEVLRQMAQVICYSVRDTDLVARWGGEEFLVILPGTTCAMAVQIAERVRLEVASMEVEVPISVATRPTSILRVTVSLGVSQLKEGEELEVAINRADKLMYLAKTRGRNQCASEMEDY